jgi:hypothetical protein
VDSLSKINREKIALLPSAKCSSIQLREGLSWDHIRERNAVLNVDIGIGYLLHQRVVHDRPDGVAQDQAEGVKCSWKFLKRELCAEGFGRPGGGERPDAGSRDHQLQAAAGEGRASRRTDLNRCKDEAEIAKNFVGRSRCRRGWHRIDKRIGERLAPGSQLGHISASNCSVPVSATPSKKTVELVKSALAVPWQSQFLRGKRSGHCGGNAIGGQTNEGVGAGTGMIGRGWQNFANTSSFTSASTWISLQMVTSSSTMPPKRTVPVGEHSMVRQF